MPINPMLVPFVSLMVAMPLLTGQDGTQQASQVDVVEIGIDRQARMTVPVQIGKHGPFEFMIDTGAQNTVLSTGLATRLALPITGRAKIIGIAGTEMADTVEIDQIDLGKRSYYGLLAPLLRASDMGADGIIGLDSLQGQRVQIDFRKGLMAVSDSKSLGGNRGYDIIVTARRKSGQLIMANARIDGVNVEVVIDTGSETSIGNMALQNRLARRGPQEQNELRSVTGQTITANIGYARTLQIGDVNFMNVMIAYADSPAFAALGLDRKPALLLGMRDLRQLDRIAIDFSTRRIYFDVPSKAFERQNDSVRSRMR
jgi:predicted aspartyl protease